VLEAPAQGPPLDLARLRAHVAARLDAAPRLRQRLAPTPLGLAPPAWVDDAGFDVARHVRSASAPAPVDEARLRQVVAELMSERLDRAHPLWTLHLVEELEGGGCALVWKLHHCMADGTAALRLGAEALWDPELAGPSPVADAWRPAAAPSAPSLLAAALRDRAGGALGGARAVLSPRAWRAAAGGAARLPGTLARELGRARQDSPLDRRIGRRREVAFALVPLADLKRIEHAQPGHVTVNDVVLALVAGGLWRWIERHGAAPHELRVQVPVSLHDRDAHPDALANRDSFICVGLPLDEADPIVRLRRINAATQECKRDHDAETLDAFFHELRHAAPPLARFAARLASSPRAFALSVSNLPGPAEDRYLAGARIRQMLSVAEIGERHPLRITALSYAGEVGLGLCADPTAVEDLDALAAGIEREAAALLTGV
jgi:diacylglycerol O-acyltransferase / wax synthase